MNGMQKILGCDIGITSIGWAYVEGEELKDCGVRIFTKAENPKTGESLALPRREARSTRRRLARRKGRLNAIKRLLCKEFGLNLSDYLSSDGDLPKAYQTSKDTKSPYELRTLALEQKLEPKDFVRVILHIAKHRGYGNKHAKESSDDKESGKVKKAISENEKIINDKDYRSVGEYFYKEFYKKGANVRNKGGNYEHCISQELLKKELQKIFEKQHEFGFTFSNNTYKSIERNEDNKHKEVDFETAIMESAFYQRDLKDFSDKVGECIFFEGEKRAAKESLSAMEFVALTRIINTLKNLEEKNKKFGSGEVYGEEKIKEILAIVLDKGEMSYKKLREILSLDERVFFARDSKLDYAKPMQEAEKAKFIEFKNLKSLKKALGGSFEGLERKYIDEIATLITLHKSKENLKKALEDYAKKHQLEQRLNEHLEALSELDFSKHINLSLKALDEILPFMREGKRYDEAIEKAELKEHRKHGGKKDFLPPLEEYEPQLANPVVARALSEYRKVLNALLKKFGKMHKIHIEFTREVGKSYSTRKKYETKQKENLKKNNEAKALLEQYSLPQTPQNILKVKLFREQDERCAYSGEKITREHLADPKALEIDHIYPYSRSFDDSTMNKVLVFTKENQNKRDKTPFEAFGKDKEKWERIVALAQKLPNKKKNRILNKNFNDKEAGFIARNLNDTGYIANLVSDWTKNSLEFLPLSENEVTIVGKKESKVHCEAVSGTLTTNLRHIWGFENKNRDNHLHHALDAIIIAYANASMIQRFSEYYKQKNELKSNHYKKQDRLKWQLGKKEISQDEYNKQDKQNTSEYVSKKEALREDIKQKFCLPYGDFRKIVQEKIDKIFVSKPPRKRARGALHEETFYSFDDKKLLESYGGKEGVKRAIGLGKIRKIGTKIVKNETIVRLDIFKDKKGKFYGVPIYTMDFALGILPNKAAVQGKDKEGVIKDWIEMVDSEYKFCFSLFKDDLILVQKKEMQEPELCYFMSFNSATAQINAEKHNNKFEDLSENEKLLYTNATLEAVVGKSIGIKNLKVFEKYQVSPLGEYQKADFTPRQAIALKSSPKGKQ